MNMMKLLGRRRIWLVTGGLVVLLLVALGACRGQRSEEGALTASGVLHAREVSVASEFGGRIEALLAEEGEAVTAGAPLVQLDTDRVDAEIQVAEATVALAEAGLEQARAGARPGEVEIARAQLAQAEAAATAAQRAISDTTALLENPQEIDLQIAVLRAQIAAAEHRTAEAVAMKDYAEFSKRQAAAAVSRWGEGGRQRFPVDYEDVLGELPDEVLDLLPDDPGDIPGVDEGVYNIGSWEIHVEGDGLQLYRWQNINVPSAAHLAPVYWWKSWVGVNAAAAQEEGLEAALSDLYARRAEPQAAAAMVDEATYRSAEVEAQVALAESQLAALEAGASGEQIAALEARLGQAQAALDSLQEKRELYRLAAPISGVVLEQLSLPGEVAAQGAPIVTLADLSQLTLTAYVPELYLAELTLNQPVTVTVDSFPRRSFEGWVSHIADQAEFTPRNVSTEEERVTLVFAVDIRVPNPEGLLKPGMPADVLLRPGVEGER
jgi:multidrug efflux pump subunit AcrA (membrane-fusion protein)